MENNKIKKIEEKVKKFLGIKKLPNISLVIA